MEITIVELKALKIAVRYHWRVRSRKFRIRDLEEKRTYRREREVRQVVQSHL